MKKKMTIILGVLFICIGVNQTTCFAIGEEKITNPYKDINIKFDEAYDNKVKNEIKGNYKSRIEVDYKTMNSADGDDYKTKMKNKKADEEKSKLASEYSKKISALKSVSTMAYTDENYVGTNKQLADIYCGPATLLNVVTGYDISNYGKYCTYNNVGQLRTQRDYANDLGTLYTGGSRAGTPFGSQWTTMLNRYCPGNNYVLKSGEAANWDIKVRDAIVYTISKDNGYENRNYNVVVNQNKGPTSDSIGGYYNGYSAHYYAVYNYYNYGNNMWISDSNNRAGVPQVYPVELYPLARDCQSRGIIW